MKNRILLPNQIMEFARFLHLEEHTAATIEKYLWDVREFAAFLDGAPVSKEHLLTSGLSSSTMNGKFSVLSSLLDFLGWEGCRVKPLRLQHKLFRTHTRNSQTAIRLKGKIRIIRLLGKLRQKLLKYAQKQQIASGEIFLVKSGRGLSRKQIWREMKSLCSRAGVESSKVFPHNLRHLFAAAFCRVCRDIAKLANVLGHSSIAPAFTCCAPLTQSTHAASTAFN